MDICNSLNISIGTVIKKSVEKLPYLLRYVPDQDKTQKMYNKVILENGGTLKSVPDCNKNQEMCNKAVDNYPNSLEVVPGSYKIPKNVR